MTGSQDSTKSSNKRRRLHQSGSGHNGDDDEVISVYSDSSNDGGNLSSNASSPESAKMDNNFLTGPQQNSEGANDNEALSSQSFIHPKKRAAHDTTNSNNNSNDTNDDEEYFSTCRTVQVPKGVTEGQLFHVLITDTPTNSTNNNDNIIGAICPKGAKAGDTILIIEPESSPPLSPQQIATINEQRLFKGIDPQNAKWVASSFWKIVWPTLVEEGWWCKKQSQYNFGSVTFYSPTAKHMVSDKMLNQEYFESISAVLNFHKLSPGLVQLCYAYADAAKRKRKSLEVAAAKAGASRRSFSALDRWKYPTGIGALKHSRVGSHYQAQSLPEVGTFAKGEDGCILEPIENIQEQDNVNSTWREWANDDAFANEYHLKILEAKKQFRPLAASLDKPIGFCLWYYYCKYKTSANYITLKNLLRGDSNESGEHLDECVICDDGGDLICCDSCPNAYHLSCLGLKTIEDEIEWFCPDCTEERTRNLSPRKFAPSPTKKTPAAAPPGEASAATRQLVV